MENIEKGYTRRKNTERETLKGTLNANTECKNDPKRLINFSISKEGKPRSLPG